MAPLYTGKTAIEANANLDALWANAALRESWQDHRNTVNVMDEGAIGNGSHDDLPAIKSAIAKAKQFGIKAIEFPNADFLCDSPGGLVVNDHGVALITNAPAWSNVNPPGVGPRWKGASLRCTPNLGANAIGIDFDETGNSGSFAPGYGCHIIGLDIRGAMGGYSPSNPLSGPTGMIGVRGGNDLSIIGCNVQDWSKYGVELGGNVTSPSAVGGPGYFAFPKIVQSVIQQSGVAGLHTTGINSTALWLLQSGFLRNYGPGTLFEAGHGVQSLGSWWELNWGPAVKIHKPVYADANNARAQLGDMFFKGGWMEFCGQNFDTGVISYMIEISADDIYPPRNITFEEIPISNLAISNKIAKISSGERVRFIRDNITIDDSSYDLSGATNCSWEDCTGWRFTGGNLVDEPYGITHAQVAIGNNTGNARLDTREPGATINYTPALTTDGAAPTTSALNAHYVKRGNRVFVHVDFTLNSVAGISGAVYAALPAAYPTLGPQHSVVPWFANLNAAPANTTGYQARTNGNVIEFTRLTSGVATGISADLKTGSVVSADLEYQAD